MTWFDLAVAVLVTAAVVMVPGFLISFALGFRGLTATALAVPAGVTSIVLAALGAPFVGMSWGILPVVVVAVVIAVVAFFAQRLFWREGVRALPEQPPLSRWSVLALSGSVLLVLVQVVRVIGEPENISQTFDNIFHLNAIRYVLDTGSASPLHVASMTSGPNPAGFYPSGWHAVASLAAQLTGASVPVVSNAATLFFAAFAWPVTVFVLVRTITPATTPILVAGAAAATALPAFPLLMINYGVLFPYMMSLSMVALPVALAVAMLRVREWPQRLPFLLGILGTLPAVAIAHPGGFVAELGLLLVVALVAWVRTLRSPSPASAKGIKTAAFFAFLLVVIVVWTVIRPEEVARSWLPESTVGQAVGEVVTVSAWQGAVNFAMLLLVTAGVWTAVRRRSQLDIVLLGMLVVTATLYIVVSGRLDLVFRDALTGPWYNNVPRLSALLPLAWVPLAALGGERLFSWAQGVTAPRLHSLAARRWSLGAVAVTVLILLPQVLLMRYAVADARAIFASTDDARLLTNDERELLNKLDDLVPEDAVILGSPWTGTALAYAIADREVVMTHTLMTVTDDEQLLLDDLREARTEPEVCEAAERLGVEYVLDFGTQEVNDGKHQYPGLRRLSASDVVEKVDAVGDAALYRIVACG